MRSKARASLPEGTALTFIPQALHCCTRTLRQVSLSSTTSTRAPRRGPSRSVEGCSRRCGSRGRVSHNVLPRPWLVLIPNSPCISEISCLAMTRPRCPPSLLLDRKCLLCSSACNSASRSPGAMGSPLSCTAMRKRGALPRWSSATTRRISPCSVFFRAFSKRLSNAWRRRVGSPLMTRGTCG
ncbi:hypothetical protein D3C78_702150 [compost metagenome]